MNDRSTISRRTLVKSGLGAIAAPTVLRVLPAEAQSQVIKIGHVSPRTGPNGSMIPASHRRWNASGV